MVQNQQGQLQRHQADMDGLAQELLQTQRRLSSLWTDADSELCVVQQTNHALANQLAEVQAAASLLQARVDHQLPRPTPDAPAQPPAAQRHRSRLPTADAFLGMLLAALCAVSWYCTSRYVASDPPDTA